MHFTSEWLHFPDAARINDLDLRFAGEEGGDADVAQSGTGSLVTLVFSALRPSEASSSTLRSEPYSARAGALRVQVEWIRALLNDRAK